jgi:hypothetical protein
MTLCIFHAFDKNKKDKRSKKDGLNAYKLRTRVLGLVWKGRKMERQCALSRLMFKGTGGILLGGL